MPGWCACLLPMVEGTSCCRYCRCCPYSNTARCETDAAYIHMRDLVCFSLMKWCARLRKFLYPARCSALGHDAEGSSSRSIATQAGHSVHPVSPARDVSSMAVAYVSREVNSSCAVCICFLLMPVRTGGRGGGASVDSSHGCVRRIDHMEIILRLSKEQFSLVSDRVGIQVLFCVEIDACVHVSCARGHAQGCACTH